MITDLAAKRLELLREALPHVRRVAVLMRPDSEPVRRLLAEIQIAAKTLGIQLQPVEADPRQLAPAFATATAVAPMQSSSRRTRHTSSCENAPPSWR